MKNNDLSNKKVVAIRRKVAEMDSKKRAWEAYERNLRRANSGYSELDLTLDEQNLDEK